MTAQKPLTDMALFRKKVKVTIQGKMAGTACPAICFTRTTLAELSESRQGSSFFSRTYGSDGLCEKRKKFLDKRRPCRYSKSRANLFVVYGLGFPLQSSGGWCFF